MSFKDLLLSGSDLVSLSSKNAASTTAEGPNNKSSSSPSSRPKTKKGNKQNFPRSSRGGGVQVLEKERKDPSSFTPRILQKNFVSEGFYDESNNEISVTKKVGKHWNFYGSSSINSSQVEEMTVRPEEALILMENNQLLLKKLNESIPISIQEGFDKFLRQDDEETDKDDKLSMSEYYVYRDLIGLGYKVVRHSMNQKRRINVKEDEISNLESHQKNHIQIPNLINKSRITLIVPPLELLPYKSWPKKKTYTLNIRELAQISTVKPVTENTCLDFSNSGWISNTNNEKDSFRGFYRQEEFNNPNVSKRAHYSKSGGNITSYNKRRRLNRHKFGKPAIITEDFNEPCEKMNVDEVKILHEDENDDDKMEIIETKDIKKDSTILSDSPLMNEGPLRALWKGKTKPLLNPCQATSTLNIYKTIDIFKKTRIGGDDTNDKNSLEKIHFDVYRPNVQYKKSSPSRPNYRIVVTNSFTSDNSIPLSIPKQKSIENLLKDLSDKVPLIVASVNSSGSVMYYCFSSIQLPIDITLG